ncbi:MAG: DUF1844 domain-containing protein [Kiritimatiellae bacterium]|nr:DUF1844 domain-containing protein [Kiritimatiellia bacterium]
MVEQQSNGQEQLHRALFSSLVSMLSATALQQLGKLVNPLTNKTEINLEGAQVTIDMLAMLEAKTRGNLDPDEERMLRNSLATLQMNYVEVAEATASRSGEKEHTSPEQSQCSSQASTPAGETSQKEEQKAPRFRKSYGTS